MLAKALMYVARQASSPFRYALEQTILFAFGWVPTIVGIGVRSIAYRTILRMRGVAAVECRVRIRFANNITLGHGTYLDEGTYLHACRNGICIGDETLVMHGAILHVYNFRSLPHSGIWIGERSLIGERCIIRGQGGVHIGNRVYLAPSVQLLAVNHVFDDPTRPIIDQGITAEGIVLEDDVWVGAGAVVADGVTIGRGAVVAAGAVVTANVETHTVVAGIPARLVRRIDGSKRNSNQEIYYCDQSAS